MKWDNFITILLIITLLIVVLSSCMSSQKNQNIITNDSKEVTKDNKVVAKEKSIHPMIEGTWIMYKEICCGRRNQERTGEAMTVPKMLEFKTQKEVMITDVKTKKSKLFDYQIEKKRENNEQTVFYITFTGKPRGIFKLENDELVIDYGYIDLQKEYYRKVKTK